MPATAQVGLGCGAGGVIRATKSSENWKSEGKKARQLPPGSLARGIEQEGREE